MSSIPRLVLLPSLLASLLMTGCGGDPPPSPAERAERMAAAGLYQVDAALAQGRREAAMIYAEEILQRYPDTSAGRRLLGEIDALREAATGEREQRRLAEMWTYHTVDYDDGSAHTAYVFGQPEQEGAPALRLVLRRHPDWGQNAYLLIEEGADFACRKECRLRVTADDGEPDAFVVTRATEVDHPALFLEEDARVLAAVEQARVLRLEIDLASAGTTAYRFETGGFDIGRLGAPQTASRP
jgi:hypothetical protein